MTTIELSAVPHSRLFTMLRASSIVLATLVVASLGTQRSQAQGVNSDRDVSGIEITLHDGGEEERQAETQLRRILATYDTTPWTFTRSVRIESGAIPHSHPVITLSTRYLDDDVWQLSTYLHEQAHWFVSARDELEENVIEQLRRRYPDVPTGSPDGGRTQYSTYLHLVVNWLEFDAMTALIGEDRARALLARKHYYRWIYERVLEDAEEIGAILAEHNVLIQLCN